MTDPLGVNLLPATNEWVYDTLPHRAARLGESVMRPQNRYAGVSGLRTDYSLSIDQLQAAYPACTTVSLVVAWFGNSADVTKCAIYPSTTFIGGRCSVFNGSWQDEPWTCSVLTQLSDGLIPITQVGDGSFVYGGTPSDPSVVRCIQDLKARGFRVAFYPFVLMDCDGFPWRGRIAYAGADVSVAARNAVQRWLGPAAPSQFSRDTTNLTVGYAGSPTDWTFRRMILHYANLCVIAGGVDLFLIGSEFRGLESVRGPGWTKGGTAQTDGTATWDYPFVTGLIRLAGDVRGIFDAAGLTKDTAGLHNLIAYSPDWSSWMGVQHADSAGQWPHLDELFAHSAVDLVSFDNYLPLSDWTTGGGGLDALYWQVPKPAPWPAAWPPAAPAMNGLGLSGPPFLASMPYLKGNIEGGEKYSWFYYDGSNLGLGLDPKGSAQRVSRPTGDRLAQARSPYQPGQEILANKMLRWWWNNPHRAVYDAGDGQGWVPHGPVSKWQAQSKPITFAEYGFPTCDRCSNQPNVFYDPKSSESFTPYWSVWDSADGGFYRPRRDDTLAQMARDAVVEYWTTDGHNATSAADVKMIEPAFMSVWNWDARPFPVFPQSSGIWGDTGNWRAGTWVGGKGPSLPPALPDAPPPPASGAAFPALTGQGWSTSYRPLFVTQTAAHASGRYARAARTLVPLWEITMRFDVLSDGVAADVQALAGFYATMRGQGAPFSLPLPAELGLGGNVLCRFADDDLDVEGFAQHLFAVKALTLATVRT